jgi:hypothetical protein
MKNYDIINTYKDDKYSCLVIICNANSPHDYISSIRLDLNRSNIKGSVLIDQFLHVGNNESRFLTFKHENNTCDNSLSVAFIEKGSIYRKVTCDYLLKNGLIDNSILTSIQKRMIRKGIYI